jgi:carboxylesterase type B
MIYILDCPQAPEEVDDWSTPLEATEDGNLCPQYDISQGEPVGDEDCLRQGGMN